MTNNCKCTQREKSVIIHLYNKCPKTMTDLEYFELCKTVWKRKGEISFLDAMAMKDGVYEMYKHAKVCNPRVAVGWWR